MSVVNKQQDPRRQTTRVCKTGKIISVIDTKYEAM